MKHTIHRLSPGPSVKIDYMCFSCGKTYEVTFDDGAVDSVDHECQQTESADATPSTRA